MEELLNKLIEKGWKPFGNEKCYKIKVCKIKLLRPEKGIIRIELSKGRWEAKWYTTVRTICSKESGLWQFVCENGMVEDKWGIRYKANENNDINDANYMSEFYYWLLESSLKDESELEDFLLQNIVIKDE